MARKRLDENLGSVSYDNRTEGHPDSFETFTVRVAGGQGVLGRGTLLAAGEGGMVMISEATTGKAAAVLAQDTDTGGGAVAALAYRSGHFNAGALIVADGYEITDGDKAALRAAGILVSDTVEVPVGVLETATMGRARLGPMILGG